MIELSEVMNKPNAVIDWANRITYNTELSSEDKEVNECLDAWAKELGARVTPIMRSPSW